MSVPSSSTKNGILGNSIYSNGGLGIDLNSDGLTPNDANDADTGGNNLQNFPVLSSAAGGVVGTLNSAPNATYRVEFFSSATCDPSGNGEGAIFVGLASVTTNAAGNAAIPLFTASPGQFITATATDAANNTSEFSVCAQASAGGTARTWVSNTSGNWEDPANWSGGSVPQPGDDVVINVANGIVVSVHSATVTLNSFQSDELVSISGGSVTFNGPAEFNGGLQMSGGIIDGPGAILLSGNSHWTGGSIIGLGAMTVLPAGSLQVGGTGFGGVLVRSISNQGFLAWDQASLQLTNGSTIVNEDGGEMVVLSELVITNNSGVPLSLINHGNFTKVGGGPLTLTDVAFVSDGDIHLDLGERLAALPRTSEGRCSGEPSTLASSLASYRPLERTSMCCCSGR